MKLSICVFIKNNNAGGFCLWESMATLMPLADEFFVLDLGSTDGTYTALQDLASKNKKIRLEQGKFPVNRETGMVDAGSFAELPNAMIPTCKNELVMYYQADEIFHEHLIKKLKKRLEKPVDNGLSFWRYQLGYNFQQIKWFPHIVHRIDRKDRFNFIFEGSDGMNSDRYNDAELFSDYNGGWFTRWGAEYSKGRKIPIGKDGKPYIYGTTFHEITEGKRAVEMPTNDMILDVSSIGAFLENIGNKSKYHAPMWRTDSEAINIGGVVHNLKDWYNKEKDNEDWTKKTTPFNIPKIMKPLLGQQTYPIRQEVLEKICYSK